MCVEQSRELFSEIRGRGVMLASTREISWFVCVQVELAGERHRAEDQVSRLEAELEALKERLQERAESQVYGVV